MYFFYPQSKLKLLSNLFNHFNQIYLFIFVQIFKLFSTIIIKLLIIKSYSNCTRKENIYLYHLKDLLESLNIFNIINIVNSKIKIFEPHSKIQNLKHNQKYCLNI